VERARVLASLLNNLEKAYLGWNQYGLSAFVDEWSSNSLLFGLNVEVETGADLIKGVVEGINDQGLLILRKEDGKLKHIISGDVHIKKFKYW